MKFNEPIAIVALMLVSASVAGIVTEMQAMRDIELLMRSFEVYKETTEKTRQECVDGLEQAVETLRKCVRNTEECHENLRFCVEAKGIMREF